MYYNSFNNYLRTKYGEKVRRISLNASLSCPNKQGQGGGCIFCNEEGFSQFPDADLSVKEQIKFLIKKGKDLHGVKKFIAYFQNATNTNADPKELKKIYDSVRGFPEIVSLYIATRPDCIDDKKLGLISTYSNDYEVWIEYGMQSVHDRTLDLLKRGHTSQQAFDAILRTSEKGIKVGVHVILGLPGESKEDIMQTAKKISTLPVSGVKLHVLHVLKDTELSVMYKKGKLKLLEMDEYVELACSFLEHLPEDCVIFRLVSDARKEVLVAPKWINNKLAVINAIDNEFQARGTKQGFFC